MKKKIFGLLFGVVLLGVYGLITHTYAQNPQTPPPIIGPNSPQPPTPLLQKTVPCTEKENSFGVKVCPNGCTRINGVCTQCNGKDVCCGIKLNTDVPFIGTCITLKKQDLEGQYDMVTEETAFPTMIGGLTKILMTVILIVCFLVLIYAGVLRTTGDSKKGKDLIKGVAIAIALLGVSGIVLRLVNPNFFG